jgi:hypothetical protein
VNILANQSIVKTKLIERGESWVDFLDLVTRFGLSDRVRSDTPAQPAG